MVLMNNMLSTDLSEKDKRHHLHAMTNPVLLQQEGPEMVVRAEGIYLYTSDGRKVMDAASGLANVNIGYGNPRICDAATSVMKQLSFGHVLLGRSNPWAAALSAKLAEVTPPQFQSFFFASSGSEAIESAVKIALRYWRVQGKASKQAVISRWMSYHGGTLFATSLTGIEFIHNQFGLTFGDRVHHTESTNWYSEGKGQSQDEFCRRIIQAFDDKIRQIGPDNIAAFVGDPIQTMGVVVPPLGYWKEVRRLCDQYDILLIADEVITGFGKTGRMFGFENFDYEPDLIVMGKGLSSGYFPISSVGVGSKVDNIIRNADEVFAHTFTNCGHPVGAAVALENIAIIEEHDLVRRVREEIGPYLAEQLQQLLAFPCIGAVRSIGVLGGFSLDFSRTDQKPSSADVAALHKKVFDIAWKRGLTIRGVGSLVFPMIITKEQIDEAIGILKASIAEALS